MKRLSYIFTFLFLQSALVSHAAINLVLNTDTKEFAFTGSDTGTPNTDNSFTAIRWIETHSESASNSTLTSDAASSFTSSSGSPKADPFDTRISYFAEGFFKFIVVEFNLENVVTSEPNEDPELPDVDVTSTVTGTGIFQSYAALSADAILHLESYIGSTISHSEGNDISVGGGFGYSDLNVVAVPEPATAAGILGMLSLLCLARRRRR